MASNKTPRDLFICLLYWKKVLEACVVPSVNHSFIFGSDFGNKLKLILDYKHVRWDIQSEVINERSCLLSDSKNNEHSTELFSLNTLDCQQKVEAEQVIKLFEKLAENHA